MNCKGCPHLRTLRKADEFAPNTFHYCEFLPTAPIGAAWNRCKGKFGRTKVEVICWRSRTSTGDKSKHYVFLHPTPFQSKEPLKKGFTHQGFVLTAKPQNYGPAYRMLRWYKGKCLIVTESSLRAETWIMIGKSVSALLNRKPKDI